MTFQAFLDENKKRLKFITLNNLFMGTDGNSESGKVKYKAEFGYNKNLRTDLFCSLTGVRYNLIFVMKLSFGTNYFVPFNRMLVIVSNCHKGLCFKMCIFEVIILIPRTYVSTIQSKCEWAWRSVKNLGVVHKWRHGKRSRIL